MPAQSRILTYSLLPSQTRFVNSTRRHVMYSGGFGSGLMGSLASGAAMGAGFAVGEEVVDHMMGGGERGERYGGGGGGYADNQPQVDPNADMGGNDFGVSGGDSWDDGSSGGGGDDGGW